MTQCTPVEVYKRFGKPHCLHLHGRKSMRKSSKHRVPNDSLKHFYPQQGSLKVNGLETATLTGQSSWNSVSNHTVGDVTILGFETNTAVVDVGTRHPVLGAEILHVDRALESRELLLRSCFRHQDNWAKCFNVMTVMWRRITTWHMKSAMSTNYIHIYELY